jgi:thiamine-monophosphate kinase
MESDFIRWLRDRLPPHPSLRVGLGDDAAILRLADRADTVVTTDLLTDGVDFRLSEIDPRRAGRKALAVNLSDLAAMAARPVAVVVSLALPRKGCDELARQLYEGLLPLAGQYDVAVAGGDTNTWDGPLAISITAIGETTDRGPLCRRGAVPGDSLVVTGQFGGSILGKHLDFEPRVAEAILLSDRYELHAGIDVSDGLSLDLARLVAESGCGAEIDSDAVPVAPAAHELAKDPCGNKSPLDHALGDGEDFELVLAIPPAEASRLLSDQPLDVPVTRIGRCTAELGLWTRDPQGGRHALLPTGWEHVFDE